MQPLPHKYVTSLNATADDGNLTLTTPGVAALTAAPPAEFDGPGDQWSPESLLVAAVASCFALTFKAVARASGFDWLSLDCEVQGSLDKGEDGKLCFTGFSISADLRVAQGNHEAKALRLLDKAEHGCLISNSLAAPVTLAATVRAEEAA